MEKIQYLHWSGWQEVTKQKALEIAREMYADLNPLDFINTCFKGIRFALEDIKTPTQIDAEELDKIIARYVKRLNEEDRVVDHYHRQGIFSSDHYVYRQSSLLQAVYENLLHDLLDLRGNARLVRECIYDKYRDDNYYGHGILYVQERGIENDKEM